MNPCEPSRNDVLPDRPRSAKVCANGTLLVMELQRTNHPHKFHLRRRDNLFALNPGRHLLDRLRRNFGRKKYLDYNGDQRATRNGPAIYPVLLG